ncbi:NlpC/P60 family protein [Actinokineospora globicatena]|uniref:C40 family peptidase n=1 Tax=Actinokineospora globicatena TaxID=103729 RepID=UPI0020A5EA76|nr:bifunctional lytic transglycosylase/C40 family peptidase [Actinokineospora globicatena]MCP2304071.1 Cell wall-associated hydrolase, NlpC family [Actinokineospora globicatena]GLW78579.1 hydrolase Nlp/P60 [Actinokineospora globicatena]GLW84754.1 hydrolase Nlp/P60 [Actinokineospora globicatena]
MLTRLVLGVAAGLLLIPVLVGNAVAAVVEALFGDSSDTLTLANCATPIADIPPDYCLLYVTAAPDCPGLPWTVLAAIGKVETDHGRSPLPGVRDGENSAGAGGPMQFLASTFASVVAAHQLPPGGASPPSRYNPSDAIHAAAFLLCDNGVRRGDLRAAIFAYNHDDKYVDKVLAQAAAYLQAVIGGTGSGDCNAIQTPNPAALTAINYACGQRGLPYQWGGNGPSQGDAGFDCSGLTTAAYAAAGIVLPRTAHTQFHAGPRVPDGQPLLPGDLVFYGTPTKIHHVGLYLGGGLMIDAPEFGQVVKIEPYRYNGDDYAGATRPTR